MVLLTNEPRCWDWKIGSKRQGVYRYNRDSVGKAPCGLPILNTNISDRHSLFRSAVASLAGLHFIHILGPATVISKLQAAEDCWGPGAK
jgi:hypothetical protein